MKDYDILLLEEHHLKEIICIIKKYIYSNARTLLIRIRN
jgi:hypothetical protein